MAAHKSHPKTASIKERQNWILNYIRTFGAASFTDQTFFDAYVAASGAHAKPEAKGQARCRTLAQDLAEMMDDGRLTAVKAGNSYSYSLAKECV